MVKYSPFSMQHSGPSPKVQAKPAKKSTDTITRLPQEKRDEKTDENKAAKFSADVENKNQTGLGSTVAPELSTDNTKTIVPAPTPPPKNLDLKGNESWLGQGYESKSVGGLVGDLHSQLSAFQDIEGGVRPNYDWKQDLGEPKSVAEAMLFTEGARNDPANDVISIPIDAGAIQRANDAKLTAGGASPEQLAYLEATSSGQQNVYMHNGVLLDASSPKGAELIKNKNKLDQYRGIAGQLVEDARQVRIGMMEGAIKQGYAVQNQAAVVEGNKQMTAMEVNANKEIAMLQRQTDERISAAQIAADKDTTATRGTQALAQIKETGTQNIAQIKQEGVQQIAALKEKQAGDLQQQRESISSQEKMQQNQMSNELLKIERESTAQQQLMSMNNDFDEEMESSKQEFQSLESTKDRALKSQDMAEYRRAAMAQEQISRDQLTLQREGQNIGLLVSISSNPALLYYMKQSGMLESMGQNLLGEDAPKLISDLTASIDPNALPNIQGYNAMSELQQRMTNVQAGATRGMSEEGVQGYMQSTAPFTRGRSSAIRIGSNANPFETQGA